MALDSFNILDTDLNVVVCIANTNFTMTYLRDNYHKFLFPYYKILGSESFDRWLISLVLGLALGLVLVLVLVLGLVLEIELAPEIEHYHISQSFDLPTATTSVSHLTCPLPPHQ